MKKNAAAIEKYNVDNSDFVKLEQFFCFIEVFLKIMSDSQKNKIKVHSKLDAYSILIFHDFQDFWSLKSRLPKLDT